MTTKDAFTEEEWTRIVRGPFVAGLAISLADPGGPIEAAKETMATIKSTVDIAGAERPVKKINDEAFLGKGSDLTAVTIQGDNLLTIGQSAFRTTDISTIDIPDSVTWIGSNAFEETSLTHVTIPDSVTHIDHDAFNDGFLQSVVLVASALFIAVSLVIDLLVWRLDPRLRRARG